MLSSVSYHKIEKEAYKIISDLKIKSAPVDVFYIAGKLKIDVVEYNLGEEAAGVLFINHGVGTLATILKIRTSANALPSHMN